MHSIWLMPSGKINDDLSTKISQLSHQYATPVFPPHITLLGELNGNGSELAAQMLHLAARICPIQVTLTKADFLDDYFRCLFLRVEETPTLLQANQEARAIFHREQDPKFMPHLSLMYGNFDAGTKKPLVASIGLEFNQTFSVSQLHLFSISADPADWRRVQTAELQDR
jgi:2'-5' RNA ligase